MVHIKQYRSNQNKILQTKRTKYVAPLVKIPSITSFFRCISFWKKGTETSASCNKVKEFLPLIPFSQLLKLNGMATKKLFQKFQINFIILKLTNIAFLPNILTRIFSSLVPLSNLSIRGGKLSYVLWGTKLRPATRGSEALSDDYVSRLCT